ncbi:MAG: hypothetical protein KDD11_23025, partial [Acidobacteria bacterium]|nr:hypothetical protein [Acidobacteriota bacterium]
RGLKSLVLDVAGREHEVAVGDSVRLELQVSRHDTPIVARGHVPAGTEEGASFLVQVDARAAKVDMVGYATELRVTPRPAFLSQFADTLAAACDDLVRVADLTPACQISHRLRERLRNRCVTTESMAKLAQLSVEDLQQLVKALGGHEESKAYGIAEALARLLKALEAADGSQDAFTTIVEAFFDLAQRLQVLAWALGQK